MSMFFTSSLKNLKPYTPGEQPQGEKLIKLNTNESPYPPSPRAVAAAAEQAARLQLYPDPACRELTEAVAELYSLAPEQVVCGDGSDELLAFIFQAFCENGAAFPDITYGFYKVWAALYGLKTDVVALKSDFSMDIDALEKSDKTLFIANPNAPTGIALPAARIAEAAAKNPRRLVVVDEAYVDFGAESCVNYVNQFDNLLVVQTSSKSRSLAGGRVAWAIGNSALISDINTVRFSFHPYSLSRTSQAAGAAAVRDGEYFASCVAKIEATRERVSALLRGRGFELTESRANFMFVKHPELGGKELYTLLRSRGVLVRWFDEDRIRDYLRVSVGSDAEMDEFLKKLP